MKYFNVSTIRATSTWLDFSFPWWAGKTQVLRIAEMWSGHLRDTARHFVRNCLEVYLCRYRSLQTRDVKEWDPSCSSSLYCTDVNSLLLVWHTSMTLIVGMYVCTVGLHVIWTCCIDLYIVISSFGDTLDIFTIEWPHCLLRSRANNRPLLDTELLIVL